MFERESCVCVFEREGEGVCVRYETMRITNPYNQQTTKKPCVEMQSLINHDCNLVHSVHHRASRKEPKKKNHTHKWNVLNYNPKHGRLSVVLIQNNPASAL